MKSSEPLNVFANLINSNRGSGITVLQSSQLTRVVTNCIQNNGRGGVVVEKDCRVELRGNGIYKNSGHGVSFSGSGQIVENDVVGNRGSGIQISSSTDIKVKQTDTYVYMYLHTDMLAQHLCFLKFFFSLRFCATVSNQHWAVALLCLGQ